MLTVVYCEDSSNAKLQRERSYDVHIRYLGTIKDRIRFAGPLATADGAIGKGDDNLSGSLFVLDEPPDVAHELMQSDPYVQSGVWQSVSVFEALDAFGRWTFAEAQPTAGTLYASLARTGGANLIAREVALFGAKLLAETTRRDVAPATDWSDAVIFTAPSLAQARTLIEQNTAAEDRRIETWAVPISVGSWVRAKRAA